VAELGRAKKLANVDVAGRKMPQIMPTAAAAKTKKKFLKKKRGRKPKTKQQNYMRRLRNFASPIFPPTPPKVWP